MFTLNLLNAHTNEYTHTHTHACRMSAANVMPDYFPVKFICFITRRGTRFLLENINCVAHISVPGAHMSTELVDMNSILTVRSPTFLFTFVRIFQV
jgi:hypothetical protein